MAGLSADEALLVLKLAFLVLLYGFILFVLRSATRDLRDAPQESIVLGAAEAARLRAEHAPAPRRFRVVAGSGLRIGAAVEVAGTTVVGRDAASGIRLDGDEFASGRHARIGVGRDAVWVEDLGSTNGTFVNGARVTGRRELAPGDVVRVGETELELQ